MIGSPIAQETHRGLEYYMLAHRDPSFIHQFLMRTPPKTPTRTPSQSLWRSRWLACICTSRRDTRAGRSSKLTWNWRRLASNGRGSNFHSSEAVSERTTFWP